jgi:hypothetical protein
MNEVKTDFHSRWNQGLFEFQFTSQFIHIVVVHGLHDFVILFNKDFRESSPIDELNLFSFPIGGTFYGLLVKS